MSRVTLTLEDGQLEGPDGMRMQIDWDREEGYDQDSLAHRVMSTLASQLIDESHHAEAAAKAASEPKVRLLLPVGVSNV